MSAQDARERIWKDIEERYFHWFHPEHYVRKIFDEAYNAGRAEAESKLAAAEARLVEIEKERAAIERRTKLRDELAPKIGGITAVPTMLDWWAKAKREGCPTCGLDFSKTPPEYNVAPHYAGACRAGLSAESKGEE